MPTPLLSPTQAAYYVSLSARSGRSPAEHMPAVQREPVERAAKDAGVDVRSYVNSCLATDPKDARIAALEAALQDVETRLGEWLADNTDEVFEEQPEIDGLRMDVNAVLQG